MLLPLPCVCQMTPPSRWLVIDPEPELRSILIHEMRQALRLPIEECTPEEAAQPGRIDGAMPVTVPSKAARVRALLPAGVELTVLEVHPVSLELMANLQRYQPRHAGELVGIASRWPEFLRIAQTLLVAAGLAPESLTANPPDVLVDSPADWTAALNPASIELGT